MDGSATAPSAIQKEGWGRGGQRGVHNTLGRAIILETAKLCRRRNCHVPSVVGTTPKCLYP